MNEQTTQKLQPTHCRWCKLLVTITGLLLMAAGALGWLISIAATNQETLVILQIPAQRSWLIAALGGAVGGLARALFQFLLDNYAFKYRYITGHPSPWVKRVYHFKDDTDMEDDYDPLESWYLFFIKPLVGVTLGLLFALAVDLGLIGLGGEIGSEDKRSMRLVVMAGLAGLFADNVLCKLEGFLTKRE